MDPLARLFGSPARLKLIRLFLFSPETTFSVAEAGKRAKLSSPQVRSELPALLASGFIRRKGGGAKVEYGLNRRFEHLTALDAFIRATAAFNPPRVVAALKQVGAIRLILLSGFFTGTQESKVDLLIVGDRLDERALARAVHSIEAELGREISYASFSTEDFRYRMGVYDRLIRDLLDYPHRLLLDKIGL